MKKSITGKKFATNVLISVAVQIVSLAANFLLYLIVPKFINEIQYAYWQMYVLYVGYVGVLHFGLLDGIVLRYSQYDYEELDKEKMRSQFKLLLLITGTASVLTASVSLLFCHGIAKSIVLLVAVGIISKNLVTYSSYSFQITNRINKYALLIITQRIVYAIIVVTLLVLRVNNFLWYCIADLAGDLIGVLFVSFFNKGMYFGNSIPIKAAFNELRVNISSGIVLMLANWSSMLLIGSAKMIIQWRWDELTFGKISFAFSVTSLFLVFITAVSVVLFPSLKRIDEDKLVPMYKNIRNLISPLLFAALFLYYPGCLILERWLPAYAGGLKFLGILLPIIVYSSKVSLLTNNYLKVYRMERKMLLINAVSASVGIVLFVVFAYVFKNLTALLISIVCVIAFNSILSEITVLKKLQIKLSRDFVIESLMSAGFIVAVALPWNMLTSFLVYLALFTVYCGVNYKSVVGLLKRLRRQSGTEQ